jgi:hypothetical protein
MDHTTTADNGGSFDPRRAAALLDQTTQQARRQFEPFPPWLVVIRATVALLACGAIWLSVRGQHPYRGPTAAVGFPAVFVFVAVFIVTATVAKRAGAGVDAKNRLRGPEIAVLAVIWLGVYVVMGVLAGAGVSRAIVYGTYPTTAPLILSGLAWAAIMAARANWRGCGTGLVIAAIGAVGAFAGPVEVWAVIGVGLFIVLLGSAAVTASRQRRDRVQP